MRRFDYSRLYDKTWDTDILKSCRKDRRAQRKTGFIHPSKQPVELHRLVEIAKIRSTESIK